MGVRNFLVEGVSCAGKTAVCHTLRGRGYHALNGDRDLAFKGDPATGQPIDPPRFSSDADRVLWIHEHQIWDEDKVRVLAADQSHPMTFFCGGSRNFRRFIGVFDKVFVLDLDEATLVRRLAGRKDEWGSHPLERDLVVREFRTKDGIPTNATLIDATAALDTVVDAILAECD